MDDTVPVTPGTWGSTTTPTALLHHPGFSTLAQLGAEVEGAAQRRRAWPTELADLGLDGVRISPGPGTPQDWPASAWPWSRRRRGGSGLPLFGLLPALRGHRRGVRRDLSSWLLSRCMARPRRPLIHRASVCWPACPCRSRRPATTRWPSWSVQPARRSRHHWPKPSRAWRWPSAISPRPIEGVQFHPQSVLIPGRPPHAGRLAGRLWGRDRLGSGWTSSAPNWMRCANRPSPPPCSRRPGLAWTASCGPKP